MREDLSDERGEGGPGHGAPSSLKKASDKGEKGKEEAPIIGNEVLDVVEKDGEAEEESPEPSRALPPEEGKELIDR